MNESFFLLHIFIVLMFLLIALRLGKNYVFALVVLQSILANIFVIKQISLFSMSVTATDIFIVGTILGQNLIQEYYSKKEALKLINISFFSMLFFLVMSKIHLLYSPSPLDSTHQSFVNIFSNTPRIVISSILVFYIAQRLDILIFAFLKKIFKDKKLSFRMFLSASITQFIDTVLFSYLALYGVVSSIFNIILFSYLIKMITTFLSSIFIGFSKYFVKKEFLKE